VALACNATSSCKGCVRASQGCVEIIRTPDISINDLDDSRCDGVDVAGARVSSCYLEEQRPDDARVDESDLDIIYDERGAGLEVEAMCSCSCLRPWPVCARKVDTPELMMSLLLRLRPKLNFRQAAPRLAECCLFRRACRGEMVEYCKSRRD